MKTRQSNFELLRIIAILCVLLLHSNTLVVGGGTPEAVIKDPYGQLIRLFWNSFCIVGVNVFVMISGWFGIKPTIKGAASLLFQVWFYCLIIIGIAYIGGFSLELKLILKMFFFGSAYWFVTEYLLLYMFSPVLNTFIEKSSPKTILNVLIGFFCLEICLSWIIELSSFHGGFSALHFLGLYLLIGYIKLYGNWIKRLPKWSYVITYLFCSMATVVIAFLGMYFVHYDFGYLHYSSPFIILSSLAIVLLFSRFEFTSKTINWFACSAFSIYLVHANPVVFPYYKNFLLSIYNRTNEIEYIIFVVIVSLIISLICMIFDKIRILIWNMVSKCIPEVKLYENK